MKILYHHRTMAEDAQGIHIREIIRALEELGNEVRVASLVGNRAGQAGKKREDGQRDGAGRNPFLYELMTLAYNLYGFFILLKQAVTFRPDFIYERYSLNTFCGILASKLFGIPILLEVNAPLSYEQKKYDRLAFRSLANFSERWICSHATRTIVVSGVMKEMLCRIGVPGDRLHVVPNGIDPEEFHPGIPCDGIRREWGLEGKIVLGFVGWFRKWHGLDKLVRLYSEKDWKSGNIHLLLVGDGPARGEIEETARRHDVSSHVTITGPVPREEISAYISAMDIALQPLAPEYASPIKIFEYMGMGKCIVAPDQPNIREVLENGRTGLLFEPGDMEDMGRSLMAAIHDPDYRKRIGENASREIFDKGYLWRENAKRAINLVFPAGTTGKGDGGT